MALLMEQSPTLPIAKQELIVHAIPVVAPVLSTPMANFFLVASAHSTLPVGLIEVT